MITLEFCLKPIREADFNLQWANLHIDLLLKTVVSYYELFVGTKFLLYGKLGQYEGWRP